MKDIPGYEGKYSINENGDIWSHTKKTNKKGGLYMKTKITSAGYKSLQLSKDGETKDTLIHRLLAEIFIENPNKKPTVNHRDGNKLNNNIDNLEWATYSENNQHAMSTGLNGIRKLNTIQIREIRRLREEEKMQYKDIASKYNMGKTAIRYICIRKTYKDIE